MFLHAGMFSSDFAWPARKGGKPSKYMQHQGKQEIARRIKQGLKKEDDK